MKRASVDETEDAPDEGDVAKRALSDPLGTETVAVNHYRVPPGEGLPAGLHAHADQEELFVVLSGRATFETYVPAADGERQNGRAPESAELVVEAGEVVRFAPGEFQSGRNDGDEALAVLALGAPRDTADVRLPVTCPECGHPTVRLDVNDGDAAFVCPDCGAERAPEPCSRCGGELRMTLDDAGRPVAACAACGAVFERPPVRE